jgi:hypothetical protein
MGSGVPIVDDALDFAGDIVGGAGDIIGDVVEGVGDVVEDLNPATIAAIIYLASTGDPSALFAETGSAAAAETVLADLGEQGFMDLLGTYGSDAAAAGEIMGGFEPVFDTANLFTPELGSGSVLTGDTFGSSTADEILSNVGGGGDISTGDIFNTGDISNTGDTFGSSTEEEILGGTTNTGDTFGSSTEDEILNSGGFTNWEDYIKNLPNISQSVDTGGILNSLSKLGSSISNTPSIPATLYAGLALADQRRINNQVMNAYNIYQADKLKKKQQYQTGEGLPSLPTTVGGIPLAQAQPRTAAQTVVRAAKGGSISDLYNEYSELNNRMRNYRKLAKGGLI